MSILRFSQPRKKVFKILLGVFFGLPFIAVILSSVFDAFSLLFFAIIVFVLPAMLLGAVESDPWNGVAFASLFGIFVVAPLFWFTVAFFFRFLQISSEAKVANGYIFK